MEFVSQDEIRTLFSRALSHMYRNEVPQYGTLIEIVQDVNQKYLKAHPHLLASLEATNELDRISEERHGAIRLGKAEELHTMRRLFAVMSMHPVGYYDLSVSAMPIHSTAFRPIHSSALKKNPFRIFTSLLRMDLIENKNTRELAEKALQKRDIFTPRARELIFLHEKQGGLTEDQANEFIVEAIETFRWHETATLSKKEYTLLNAAHPLVADIVSFKGPHINHLTPRTLDINAVQREMPHQGLNPKAVIEGPPTRETPILLRQTSFKALEEAIQFPEKEKAIRGKHRARFGEIEQRGVALRPTGFNLYSEKTELVRRKITPKVDGSNSKEYYLILNDEFADFPDDLEVMRQQELVYLAYSPTEKGLKNKGKLINKNLESLLQQGFVDYTPIVYEDFLPVSAAGIFTSNLGEVDPQALQASGNQAAFEEALGAKVHDPFSLYQRLEEESIAKTLEALDAN